MAKKRSFIAENLTIVCDGRCPLYYCGDPCRVQEHAKSYARLLRMGRSCSVLKEVE